MRGSDLKSEYFQDEGGWDSFVFIWRLIKTYKNSCQKK